MLMHDRKESVILYSSINEDLYGRKSASAFRRDLQIRKIPKGGDYVRPHLVIKLERIHSVLLSFFSPIFYFAVVSQVLMTFAIRSNSLYASYGLGSCSNRRTRTYERSAYTLSIYLWPSCSTLLKNSPPRRSQLYRIYREAAELMGTFFDVVAIDLCSLMERAKRKAKRALRTIYVRTNNNNVKNLTLSLSLSLSLSLHASVFHWRESIRENLSGNVNTNIISM